MPSSVAILVLILGSGLLLAGLTGKKVNIFGLEMDSPTGKWLRLFMILLGVCVYAGVGYESGVLKKLLELFGGGSTPVPIMSADTVRPFTPAQPAASEPLNVAGYWHDNAGWRYHITQQGDVIEFYGSNSREGGRIQGRGTINGNRMYVEFQTDLPSTGRGNAVISSDGRQVSGSYRDTEVGEYSQTFYRE